MRRFTIALLLLALTTAAHAAPSGHTRNVVLIVPDHGRGNGSEWRGHGAKYAHFSETWLIAMGPDTPAGGEMQNTAPITDHR